MKMKYRYVDRAGYEEALRAAEARAHRAERCVMALVRKDVIAWFRRGQYAAGVVDRDAPDGGRVIVTRTYYSFGNMPQHKRVDVTVFELESWVRDTQAQYVAAGLADEEARAVFDLSEDVANFIRGS